MTKAPRHSRYHCAGNPAPYLDCVLKQIRKAAAGQGFIRSKPEIRALAAKANQDYSDRGKSDDLVRFLLNTGIMIELANDKCVYFDAERAAYILKCCSSKKEPSIVVDPARRVLDILRQVDLQSQASCNPRPAAPAPVSESAPAKPATIRPPAVVALSKVIYLTPPEEDIWNTLALMVEERPDGFYLSLPFDEADVRQTWVKEHLKCDDHAFVEMVCRLVIAREIATVSQDRVNHIWRLARHPFAYHVIKIEQRPVHEVKQADVDIAIALERDFIFPAHKPFMAEFKAFLEARFPGANAGSYYTKMVSYKPEYRDKYWGILFRHRTDDGVVTLTCVPGFEGLSLVHKADASAQQPAKPSEVEVKTAESTKVPPQAATTMPSPPPEPAVATPQMVEPAPASKPAAVSSKVSVRQLTEKEEAERRRLIENADDERLAKIIQESSTLLENVQKSLAEAEAEKQRREAARVKNLMARQAQLIEECRQLQNRLAEIDRELAEVDSKLRFR